MFNNLKSHSNSTLDNSTLNLRILNQNILYLTREVDLIVRLVKQLTVNKDLQHQVDKYFEDDETSPQTEPEEQTEQ